jgi:hypothetical protein
VIPICCPSTISGDQCALCVSPHTLHIHVYLSYSTIWIGLSTNSPTCLLCFHFYWFAKQLPLTSPSTHLPSDYLKSILSTVPNTFLLFPLCPGCPPGFRFPVWFSSGFSSCLFSVFWRMSPHGGLDHVMVSKSLLTLSFSICFSSSTTLFVRFSILFPWSIMISTSCSVPNCFNISGSSFGGSLFSITAIFSLSYHTCQYPTT